MSSDRRFQWSGTHSNTSRVSGNNFKDGAALKARSLTPIGDLVIKHVDPKKFSQQHVHKFSDPGKKIDEMGEVVNSIAVVTNQSHIIIHTGTNNLPTDSTESCAAKIKNLALKVKNKFPNASLVISRIVYREDINVDSKRMEINELQRERMLTKILLYRKYY